MLAGLLMLILPGPCLRAREASKEGLAESGRWSLSICFSGNSKLDTTIRLDSSARIWGKAASSSNSLPGVGRMESVIIIRQREQLPLAGRGKWEHEYLPSISLSEMLTNSKLCIGAVDIKGLFQRMSAPFGRSLAPLSPLAASSFSLDSDAAPSRQILAAVVLATSPRAPWALSLASQADPKALTVPRLVPSGESLSLTIDRRQGPDSQSIEAMIVNIRMQGDKRDTWFASTPLYPAQDIRLWALS